MSFDRSETITSLYEYACVMPFIDLRGLMGVTTVNCVEDSYKNLRGCHFSWPEYTLQSNQAPSRVVLTQRIAEAERVLAEYLGFWPGPHYEEGEIHNLSDWGDTIKLQYKKILATGEQIWTESETSTNREFDEEGGWGFNNVVRYTFSGVHTCNFVVYPESRKGERGYMIREFETTNDGINTVVEIPVYLAIDPDKHNRFPTPKLDDLDLCNQDNYPENMVLYTRSFTVPAGKAILEDYPCYCSGQGTCQSCQQNMVDICLLPVDTEEGIFQVLPIQNTAEEGQPECWERLWHGPTHLNRRYEKYPYYPYDHYTYFNHNDNVSGCHIDPPRSVKINYLSGCGGCWGDDCLPLGVCDDLKLATAYLATSFMAKICDCGCLDDIFNHYQKNMQVTAPKGDRLLLTDKNWFDLGTTMGAIEAYKLVRRFVDEKIDYGVII